MLQVILHLTTSGWPSWIVWTQAWQYLSRKFVADAACEIMVAVLLWLPCTTAELQCLQCSKS